MAIFSCKKCGVSDREFMWIVIHHRTWHHHDDIGLDLSDKEHRPGYMRVIESIRQESPGTDYIHPPVSYNN